MSAAERPPWYALDNARCVVLDQAVSRLYVQQAVLVELLATPVL